METNRDAEPLTDAERARRYRARLRGEDVPLGTPGRKPAPDPLRIDRVMEAAGVLYHELPWLKPDCVTYAAEEHALLPVFLDLIAEQIARLRARHDS